MGIKANPRRAGNFGELQHGGHFGAVGKAFSEPPTVSNYNRSDEGRARYSEREAERRKREARHRIERTQEQRRAARWFSRVEVMRRV